MKFHTKALYNLLRLNSLEDSSITAQKWQIENLRDCSLDEIFAKLNDINIQFDRHTFVLYANNLESPEVMTELILNEVNKIELFDRAYLLVFELWRRLLPEKQTLSIFCDELDHRIYQYDNHTLENDEMIQDILANLIDILNENVDLGAGPKEIFKSLIEYSAHDLEEFLYDYIYEQIDAGNFVYAIELIEGFYAYLDNYKLFDFLKARIAFKDDIVKANELIKNVYKELKKDRDLDLQLEILRCMVQAGDRDLFVKIAKFTLETIQIEEDFHELMEIVADFYRRLDQEDIEKAIQQIMKIRLTKKPLEKISLKDPDIKKFKLTLS